MSEETPDNAHLENYMRRYANDRDEVSETESITPSETTPVGETSDNNHLEDYFRRYGNDRTS